jgi:hypothetical protein
LRVESRGFETYGSDEGIEIVDDALIEAIELRSSLGFESGILEPGLVDLPHPALGQDFTPSPTARRSLQPELLPSQHEPAHV